MQWLTDFYCRVRRVPLGRQRGCIPWLKGQLSQVGWWWWENLLMKLAVGLPFLSGRRHRQSANP